MVFIVNYCVPKMYRVILKSIFLQPLPPYNGFGSLEDSRQNCLTLRPKPPKKDILKMLENQHMVLRYTARMVGVYTKLRNLFFIKLVLGIAA